MFGLALDTNVIMMGIILIILVGVATIGVWVINFLEKDTRQFCQGCKAWIETRADLHNKGDK